MDIYKCQVCGNVVELLYNGGGTLVCCDQNMHRLAVNTEDSVQEKHVPVIEKTKDGYKVTIGSALHPMEEKHYIQWIELIAGNQVLRQHLKPGEKPVAVFKTEAKAVVARELCNIHGLWVSEKKSG